MNLYEKLLLPLLLLILVAVHSIYAQPQVDFTKEDPYNKPELWKRIKANPNDSSLWVKYTGKSWKAMTPKERENIARIRQELYIQSIAEQESIIGELDNTAQPTASVKGEALFVGYASPQSLAKPKTVSESDMKQLAQLEAMIMQERNDIAELKKNIFENFLLIEDALKEEFASFGVEYRYYSEVHPDGKYNEVRWIEEQELRLKQLKQKKVAELKKKIKGQ
ncbi:MAG: hypothetical protein RMJ87_08130 [Cytophagales bacterium]|nr:hypothetical protein [Bernardetiaceae bacterium]MDW8204978.1 hypothetical protein [Cytophagales bacterium]